MTSVLQLILSHRFLSVFSVLFFWFFFSFFFSLFFRLDDCYWPLLKLTESYFCHLHFATKHIQWIFFLISDIYISVLKFLLCFFLYLISLLRTSIYPSILRYFAFTLCIFLIKLKIFYYYNISVFSVLTFANCIFLLELVWFS